jgi:F-type H+-transporting ATPase subunit epsilon
MEGTLSHTAIRCTVVSPERPLFEGVVERVIVPGIDGEIGILPRHAPMIAVLGPGTVRLHVSGVIERWVVRGGFVHVKKNVVTLLVTDAVRVSDVNRASLQAELESVIEALRHPESTEAYEELLVRRRWCEVRLSLMSETRAAHEAH